MIFVTVGTQKFPFDRLAAALDQQIEGGLIPKDVIAQIGYTNYLPKHYKAFRMLSPAEADACLAASSFVITHGGTSSIIKAVKLRRKVLVVPRLRRYGEHVDDHQLEIARVFEARGIVECAYDVAEIPEKLERMRTRTYAECKYDNRMLLDSLASDLRRFLA